MKSHISRFMDVDRALMYDIFWQGLNELCCWIFSGLWIEDLQNYVEGGYAFIMIESYDVN